MACSIFGSSHTLPLAGVVFAALLLAVLVAAATALLYKALDESITLDVLLGPRPRLILALVSSAALAVFFWRVLWPLLPDRIFGALFWPMRLSAAQTLRHVWTLALLGGAAFCLASQRITPRLIAAGAAAGMACAWAGVFANSGLHAAGVLWKIAHRTAAGFLVAGLPALLAGSTAFWLLLAVGLRDLSAGRKLAAGLACLLLLAPVELLQAHLRGAWDSGRASLADAADVAGADSAEGVTVLILADAEGDPGVRSREDLLSAEGIAAGPVELLKIGRYLEERRNKTVFLRQALSAMRRGWALLWEPELRMNACMLHLGSGFPPDYEGFLENACVAPATPENFERLEKMSKLAWDDKIGSVKQAQKVFEGFSTAYARFGDLDSSNLWIERIQRLWPLYEDPIHMEPIADRQDGVIEGALLLDGLPATGVKVGLFALPSTMTAISARQSLSASVFPDSSGRFRFDSLLPGRYYLALQAAPSVLPRGAAVRNAPGVIALAFGEMRFELETLQVYTSPPVGAREPAPEAPADWEFLIKESKKKTNSVLK
ncbi:MAG: carboxypeptidase-like regulatory domain-containing protein [Elusimicrobiota bacterium]